MPIRPIVPDDYDYQYKFIIGKACLCELGCVLITNKREKSGHSKRLFARGLMWGISLIVSLKEMMSTSMDINLIDGVKRSNLFVNELRQYIDYIEKEIQCSTPTEKDKTYFREFKSNLVDGIPLQE